MNKLDHLLTVLSEESHEIGLSTCALGQAASKALRFGLQDGYPGTDRTNLGDMVAAANVLMREVHDLVAVVELLEEAGCHMDGFERICVLDQELIERKKAKVKMFLEYSSDKGRLDEDKTT